jgi:hypothetical protein
VDRRVEKRSAFRHASRTNRFCRDVQRCQKVPRLSTSKRAPDTRTEAAAFRVGTAIKQAMKQDSGAFLR